MLPFEIFAYVVAYFVLATLFGSALGTMIGRRAHEYPPA